MESKAKPSADLKGALTPISEAPPTITPPPTVAGGLKAISSSLKHAFDKMGPIRATKALSKLNQDGGFDCPGCAWPDPAKRTLTEFCENGAKAVADEATSRMVSPAFFEAHPISELLGKSDRWLNRQGRITHPMYRPPGKDHYEPISWEDAFARIAQRLQGLNSPDEAIFYTSGRTSNEAAFLYQLFVRQFGTNNLPDCSNMCHESSGTGLSEVIGVGKGTVTLEDFDHADTLIILGQNPGTNHPRMLTTLQEAARRGAKIISVNPLNEVGLSRFIHPQEVLSLLGSGTPLSTLHLPVKIGGDVALLKGLMRGLLDLEDAKPGTVLDWDFIRTYSEGFDAFAEDLRRESWDDIIQESGIPRAQIDEVVAIIAESKSMICCWAMGLTQHKNGVANIQSVANLLLMGGHMGRPGAGACPVRGHSNVQGDRTMGIWEKPPAAFLERLGAEFDFEPPSHHGLDTVAAIKAMHKGEGKIFFAMGGNFLSATPDTAYTAEALSRAQLTVQVSTKLNRSHLITGGEAIILPCLGRTEIDARDGERRFVSVENSMGVVHTSEGILAPASPHLKSEVDIIAGVALATLGEGSSVDWRGLSEDYGKIRDAIAAVIPGHENYNERVRKPGGFVLPNGARERQFPTPSGKAHFTVHPIPKRELEPGQLVMMTIRSHDQYNTTIYSNQDRYRGIDGNRRVVLIAQGTLDALGFKGGEQVTLRSHFEGEVREAPAFTIVPYQMPLGTAATYFPEANVLIPVNSFADRSRTPTSKYVVISLKRLEPGHC